MTINLKKLSVFVLVLLALFKLYLVQWQFSFHHLLVPPSPDLTAHLEMIDGVINAIRDHKLSLSILTGYQPLFKLIIGYIAVIFSKDSLTVLKAIAPYWLIIIIPPFYYLVKKMYGWQIAFWATTVFVVVSSNPLLNFADAQYPDILGYNLIAPLYLIALINLLNNGKRLRDYLSYFALLVMLFLSHYLVVALMILVSVITLLVYLPNRQDRGKKWLNLKSCLLVFCVLTVSYLLLNIFAFNYLVPMFKSAINLRAPINDATAAVLNYSLLNSLLAPFLQFIGWAGLLYCIINTWVKKDNEKRLSNILLIVWVIVLWIMSRSSLFALPQRIFREISVPLSISSGIFIFETIKKFSTNLQKIIISGLFGYLMVINFSQLNQPPFLLPDGFRDMAWFRSVDQQKYDYITENIPKDKAILTNNSNPVLLYRLEKAGYVVHRVADFVPNTVLPKNNKIFITDFINGSGSSFLFINSIPSNVNPQVYFYQYADYDKTRGYFDQYDYARSQINKKFVDGSKLIAIEKPKSSQKK